ETRLWLASVQNLFGDGAFAGVCIDDDSAEEFDGVARALEMPPVLIQDVRFAGRDRSGELDLLASVRGHSSDMGVYGLTTDARSTIHGMLGPDEISRYHARAPEAYTNAALIASRVDGDLLRAMGATEGISELSLLSDADDRDRFETELRGRFKALFKDAADTVRDSLRDCLESELDAIAQERLWGTFEQFQRVVERLTHLGVTLGPATGLRLQSITAWLLGITSFNPYEIDKAFVVWRAR
ncbi:MAG: hypothetical protein IH994_06200, partial [Proteobacteria bacterium]|nr:hypothetical protein [Pseudomonadota bacterium]